MMIFALRILLLIIMCGCSIGPVLANPKPGFEYHLYTTYWFIKTAPINYSIDLISLFIALWVTGQWKCLPWRMTPIYNIAVFIAGYTADFTARYAIEFPLRAPSKNNIIVGPMYESITGPGINQTTLQEGALFLIVATALIFILNYAIIYGILRLNDAPTTNRVWMAALVMAFITAPYLALHGNASGAWPIPLLICVIVVLCYIIMHTLTGKAHDK